MVEQRTKRERDSSYDNRQNAESTHFAITSSHPARSIESETSLDKPVFYQRATDQHIEKKRRTYKDCGPLGGDASVHSTFDMRSLDNMAPTELRSYLHDSVYTLLRLGYNFTQIVIQTGISETFLRDVFCELGLNVPTRNGNTKITDVSTLGGEVIGFKEVCPRPRRRSSVNSHTTQEKFCIQSRKQGRATLVESESAKNDVLEPSETAVEDIPIITDAVTHHVRGTPSKTPSFDFELPKKLSRKLHKDRLIENDGWTSELKVSIDSEDESGNVAVRQSSQNQTSLEDPVPLINDTISRDNNIKTEMFQQIRNLVMKTKVETSRLSSSLLKNSQFIGSLTDDDRARLQNLKSAIVGDLDKFFSSLLTRDSPETLNSSSITKMASKVVLKGVADGVKRGKNVTVNEIEGRAIIRHPLQNSKENVALESDAQVSETLINDSIVKITKVCMIEYVIFHCIPQQ